MAVMWPHELPLEISSNILRMGECNVYRKLQNVLEDPFVVYYSRPWIGLTPYGEEKDGECDFLIAHPNLGILVIEVKGGGVAYDPEKEKWTSCDRWGFTHNIKNPVQQAISSKYQILNKLNDSSVWKRRFICARHGVIFPDAEKPEKDLGADIPLRICCFLDEFENDLRGWILSRFGEPDRFSSREQALGEDGMKALEELLAHPFQLHVPMGNILAQDDNKIETLTQEQFHILETIQDIQRAVISGGAGTGKTVLAMEEAIRCADSGMRVFLTCYNKPLAEEIHHRLEQWKNITVATFHELCIRFAYDSGIPVPYENSSDQLFNEVFPELLTQALDALPEQRFDSIIIDEGQDFHPNWMVILDAALSPKGRGLLRVFIDSNQSVYGNITTIPEEYQLIPIRLTMNMRNTKRIHSIIQNYYSGYAINSIGPEGVAVEWIPANSIQEIYKKIDERIYQLVSQERMNLSDIAVLVPTKKDIPEYVNSGRLGRHEVQLADKNEENAVIIDTIRRFKGLEKRIVIIASTPKLIGERELIYVAVSRARTHLIIVGDIRGLKQSAIQKRI
jgi:superfamily I DNA/RNA helicase